MAVPRRDAVRAHPEIWFGYGVLSLEVGSEIGGTTGRGGRADGGRGSRVNPRAGLVEHTLI